MGMYNHAVMHGNVAPYRHIALPYIDIHDGHNAIYGHTLSCIWAYGQGCMETLVGNAAPEGEVYALYPHMVR